MPKIKILYATNRLGIGGTEKTLQVLCKYLDKSKYEIFVCGRLDGGIRRGEIEKYDIPVYVKPPDVDSLIQELKVHIYHVHRAGDYEPGTLPQKKPLGLKVIETNVFGELDIGENYLIDCHIFVSQWCLKKYFEKYCQFHNKLYRMIYNPVDFEEFPESISSPFHNTFGRVSRADDQKWHDVCLRIIPKVLRKIPSARCHLMGVTDRVRQTIRSLDVMNSVKIHELSLNVSQFYRSLDVFTHGARIGETFGCVIAEAMANRVPVVTLSTAGKPNAQAELVDHKINGFVCRTEGQYAGAVIELLENPSLRESFGAKAYEKARDYFDARKIVKHYETLYEELMNTRFAAGF